MLSPSEISNGSIWSINGHNHIVQWLGKEQYALLTQPEIVCGRRTAMVPAVPEKIFTQAQMHTLLTELNAEPVTGWILALVKA